MTNSEQSMQARSLTQSSHTQQSRILSLVLALLSILLLVFIQEEAHGQSQWTTNGNNINNTNTGNVGIGTTTPGGKLQVAGDTYVGSNDGTIPYAVSIGASGNGYGGIGYGMKFSTTSNAYTYSANDYASMLHFHSGGFRFRTAPLGTTGNAVTFTDIITGLNNGNVGIGTTTPSYRLHVAGNNTTAGGFPIIKLQNTQTGGHSYWLYSGANGVASDFGLFDETDNLYRLYVKGGTGNIGMGTSTPRGALDVAGGESYLTVGVTGSLGSGAILSGSTGSTFLSNNVYLNAAASQFKVVDPSKISAGLQLAGRDVYFRSFSAAAIPLHTELLFINGTSGNVGIGTITPAHKLDVTGSINASGGLCIAGDCKTAWSQVGGGGSSQWSTSGNNISNANAGNVGIGTTSPQTRLHIDSLAGSFAQQLRLSYNNNASGWGMATGSDSRLYFGNGAVGAESPKVVFDASGNVGIGTSTPQAQLHVGIIPRSSALTYSGSPAENNNGLILNAYYNSSDGWKRYADIVSIGNADGFNGGSLFRFFTNPLGSPVASERMRIDSSGNVGIGTSAPAAKLDVNGNANVNGNITVTGNINAKYQDVAEWVPSRQKLSAGTVVVLDSEQSNHVVASSSEYDTRVAGVVSAQPGVILGEAGENKAMIATTGRVKVKVDATRSPIKLGDLLVTSDKEGYAMKSEPLKLGGTPIHRPGTLIGKALESLEKGTGEILVLLSLQ